MIKAITFDLEGVYFVSGKANFIKKIVEMGISEEQAKYVFLDSPEMKEFYKTGKWGDSEYWNWAAQKWGLNMTADEFMKIYVDGCSTDDKVVKVVRELREKGFKTMICTDNFPARIKGMQDKFGFLDDFDVKIISYEVGATKASPMIYQELINQSGVLPEEIVFSDDDEKKLVAANGLGINTFVYENFDQFMGELKKLGVEI
ncbi:MAG: HAD-IA family hydrolase [Candidatus Shapirobacteria bacterium]